MNVSFAFVSWTGIVVDGGQLSRATWELLPSCKHTLFECCSEMKLTLSLSKVVLFAFDPLGSLVDRICQW
jgi:hypothetical protein